MGEGKGVKKGEALPHRDPSMREPLAPHRRRRHRWETEEGRRSLRSGPMIPKLPWSWLLKRHGQEVRMDNLWSPLSAPHLGRLREEAGKGHLGITQTGTADRPAPAKTPFFND